MGQIVTETESYFNLATIFNSKKTIRERIEFCQGPLQIAMMNCRSPAILKRLNMMMAASYPKTGRSA